MNRFLLALVVLIGCAQAGAAPAPPARLTTPTVAAILAPGDTLAYTVSWAAPVVTAQTGAASNYDFTTSVAATNGTWTVIYGTTPAGPAPASGTTTGLSFVLKLTAIPWDSVTITVSVTARNAKGSALPGAVTWKVLHGLRPPGSILPPKVDSTATVVGALFVKPSAFTLLIASYGIGPSLDSASCVIQLRLPGQHWGRGTSGPGSCVDQWGGIVPLPLRDSVRVVLGHRLVPQDTLGHYSEVATLVADTVP
jgi:hypothetical protein